MTWPAPQAHQVLTQDQMDALTQPSWVQLHKLGMPSLAEMEAGRKLLRRRYPVDAWYMKRQWKWLVKKMNKNYGVKWTTPWDKHK